MEDSTNEVDKQMYVIDISDEETDISKLILQLYSQREDCSGYNEIVPYIKKNFLKLRESQDAKDLVEELYRLHRTPHKRKFSTSNQAVLILNDFVHKIVKESMEEALKSQEKTSENINKSNNKVKIAIVGAVVTLGTGITAAIVTLVIHFTS